MRKCELYFVCICICSIIGLIGCKLISMSGVIGFVIKGLFCFVESNIVFCIMFHATKEFKELKEMIQNIKPLRIAK